MRVALCIFRFFPYGGLQKDFLRVAEECIRRGHTVHAFCGEDSELPVPSENPGIVWRQVRMRGWTNHARAKSFEKHFLKIRKTEKFDCVCGFNRMSGLDFYFAGDGCFAAGVYAKGGWTLKKMFPRYRTFLDLEEAVFGLRSRTQILTIVESQKAAYIQHYGTPESRFHCLPFGFDPRCGNVSDPQAARERLRRELGGGLKADDFAVILVGSDFTRKGADRVILALASLPKHLRVRTKLFLVGLSPTEKYRKLAEECGVEDSVFMLGGRTDVPELMCAVDLLVHPAREEAGGSVLLEAVASKLPVICTDVCGFSFQVEKWEAGMVIASPFRQETFNAALAWAILNFSEKGRPKTSVLLEPKQWRRAKAVVDNLETANENAVASN